MAATAEFATLELRGMQVVLCLHTTQDPQPQEWQRFLEHLEGAKRKSGGTTAQVRSFVVTDGGAPNAKQRESMAATAGGPLKMAVVTNCLTNPIKRGIVTALSWANPSFKALMPDRWQEALRHVDMDGQMQPMLVELEKLQRRLPPVNSLALLLAETRSNVA